ncbi:MAG: Holliday junction resolvase RuvX [Planctomycetota bacterium]|nr:MAG: Holliday junction resolvase RuvX [Planctomycetota bacterium]
MRFLGLDIGAKRTGVAVGDDESTVAAPAALVEAPLADRARWLEAIVRVVEEHEPEAIVVGLPLNMDGSTGPAASQAREIAEALARRLGLPAHLQDERLTTHQARQTLAHSGLTRKRKKRRTDALAAAHMLQAFLDDRAAAAQKNTRS